jgi:hypothetical protein
MVLFHDQFDEATTFSGSQNTNSSMSFNLRQLGGEKKMSIEVAAEILGCITKENAFGTIYSSGKRV